EQSLVCYEISYVVVRDFYFYKERVVMVMDSSPIPGNKQGFNFMTIYMALFYKCKLFSAIYIEYVAVTAFVVQLL
ncbi:MAG: hypothetical protein WBL93_01510, partial [Lutisporaceae bacterium]